jgi:predicted PurR-regulated permease PerM
VIFLVVVRSVIQPFVWAGVVAYILGPIVRMLHQRGGLRRGLAVAIVMLALLGLIAWGLAAAVNSLRSDVSTLADSLSSINAYFTSSIANAGPPTFFGITISLASVIKGAQNAIADLPHGLLHNMWPIAVASVESLLRFLTFLISTTYLLLDGPRLRHWLSERIPPRHRDEVRALGTRVDAVLSEYLRAEVILVAIMSIASLIALTVLGVRFAVILAPLVGFLEIFPIIGPIFAIAMVTLMALISPPNFGLAHVSYAVIVALVFFIMRQLEDYLVIPNVVGHAVKLHPVVILFALLCGATIGGILGMFLAVPVTGALKVLGSYAYDRLVE